MQVLYPLSELNLFRDDIESFALESKDDGPSEDITIWLHGGLLDLHQLKSHECERASEKAGVVKVLKDLARRPLDVIESVRTLEYIVIGSSALDTTTRSIMNGEMDFVDYWRDYGELFEGCLKNSVEIAYNMLHIKHLQLSLEAMFQKACDNLKALYDVPHIEFLTSRLIKTLWDYQCTGERVTSSRFRALVEECVEELKTKPFAAQLMEFRETALQEPAEYGPFEDPVVRFWAEGTDIRQTEVREWFHFVSRPGFDDVRHATLEGLLRRFKRLSGPLNIHQMLTFSQWLNDVKERRSGYNKLTLHKTLRGERNGVMKILFGWSA